MAKNLGHLSAGHKQNSGSHIYVVTEDDYRRLEPNIRLLERVSEIENSTLTV